MPISIYPDMSGWIGQLILTRPKIWDRLGRPIPNFPQFFMAFLGQKRSGKIVLSWEKSGKVGKNRVHPDFSRLPSIILKDRVGLSRRFGLPEPNNPDGRCTFINPNLNFALRSVRQCQFISPLVAHHHNSNFRHVRLRPPADILVLTGLGCFGKKKYLMQ